MAFWEIDVHGQEAGPLGFAWMDALDVAPDEFSKINLEQCERTGVESYHIGPLVDIRAVKLHFRNPEKLKLSGFQVAFDIRGQLHERRVGGGSGMSTDWIRFDYPGEFLFRVEGSITDTSWGFSVIPQFPLIQSCVNSLSFITTRQKYGPCGTVTARISFCSDPGRVVGFTGYHISSYHGEINSLEVHVVPDIIECLRNYLEFE